MIDLRCKGDLGGLKGIVGGEMNVHLEDAAGIGTIRGTDNGAGPVEEVFLCRATAAATGGIFVDITEFLFNSAKSHINLDSIGSA
jgi:hypothetical protein